MPTDPTGQPPPDDDWSAYLDEGETLLWTGVPVSDPRLRWSQVGLAIFGVPFLAAGLGMVGAVPWSFISGQVEDLWHLGALVLLFCFGLPFAAAGAYCIAGPHLMARLADRHVRYALSTRRLYIATRWWSRHLETFPIQPATKVGLIRDGLDTVILHLGTSRDREGDLFTVAARIEGAGRWASAVSADPAASGRHGRTALTPHTGGADNPALRRGAARGRTGHLPTPGAA